MMLAGRSQQMPRALSPQSKSSRKESSSKKNRDPSMGDPDLQNRLGIISAKATHKEIKYDNLYPFFVGVTTRLQRLASRRPDKENWSSIHAFGPAPKVFRGVSIGKKGVTTAPQMFPFELLSMPDRTVNSSGFPTWIIWPCQEECSAELAGTLLWAYLDCRVWPKLIRENKLRVGLAALNTIPCLLGSCQNQKNLEIIPDHNRVWQLAARIPRAIYNAHVKS